MAAVAMMPNESRPTCIPGKLAITNSQADDIVMRYAEKYQPEGDTPVGIILFFGLKDTFPCPAKK